MDYCKVHEEKRGRPMVGKKEGDQGKRRKEGRRGRRPGAGSRRSSRPSTASRRWPRLGPAQDTQELPVSQRRRQATLQKAPWLWEFSQETLKQNHFALYSVANLFQKVMKLTRAFMLIIMRSKCVYFDIFQII
jgi:hypothetical protein